MGRSKEKNEQDEGSERKDMITPVIRRMEDRRRRTRNIQKQRKKTISKTHKMNEKEEEECRP